MHMYNEYFHMLDDLWADGWNTLRPERKQLSWLHREPMGTPFAKPTIPIKSAKSAAARV
jgi:hypothetical protein